MIRAEKTLAISEKLLYNLKDKIGEVQTALPHSG